MEKEFPIKLITRRSRWIGKFSLLLLIIGFITLSVFYISMSPSKDSTTELQTLWFIEGVPIWVKRLALWGIAFLGLTILFELLNRRSKKGILNIKENLIEILTQKRSFQFFFEEIKEIAFVSPLASNKYKIFFKLRSDKIIVIKLTNYLTLDELTDSLNALANNDIKILTDVADPYWPE